MQYLLIWNGLLRGDGVVFSMDYQTWNANVKDRIHGRSVSIVSAFGRIAPSRALNMTIKFMKIFDTSDSLHIDVAVLDNLCLVPISGQRYISRSYSTYTLFKQLLQVVAHGL